MMTLSHLDRPAPHTLTVAQLRARLGDNKRLRAQLDADDAVIIGLLEADMIEPRHGTRPIPEIELMAHGGMSSREASAAVRRAHVIEDLPLIGRALASGDMTAAHVDAVARGLRIAGEAKDAFLTLVPALVDDVGTVADFTSAIVTAAKSVVADGGLATFEDQRRSTYLQIWHDAAGMVNLRGAFDPETGAILHSRLQSTVEAMFHGTSAPSIHHPWIEPNDHRRAHALIDLISWADSPSGSRRTHADVVVHIDLEAIRGVADASTAGTHRTVYGSDLPIHTIRRLACEANIIPLVLDGAGLPLDIGRGQRLASASQRRALEAIHTTCAVSHCTVAFHHCQIHHIDYWIRGGPTDLANMVPLCSAHHHAAHEGGWTLSLDADTHVLTMHPPPDVHDDGISR